jgi:hypothetical protein
MTEPDRPYATREYGRVRLTESLAGELWAILHEQIDYLYEVKAADKADGLPVTETNRRIRRTVSIRGLLHGMMHEKEWCECENFGEEDERVPEAETGIR